MKLSIIIPALNEADSIVVTLAALQALRQQGHEVIVCDGGSSDKTAILARPLADHVINTPRGRAKQMNAGAETANGDVLLFLHADTRLPSQAVEIIEEGLTQRIRWGRFDIRLSGTHSLLRMVEFFMIWRSRLTGIATGDQAIFIKQSLFNKVGGFPDIALMEDVALSKQLKRYCNPLCIRQCVLTSSRRWEENGIIKTILLMWRLRLAYFFGVSPQRLANSYQKN